MPNQTETTLKSSTGLPMFVRRWQPDGTCLGVAVLSHGVFEHSGRYQHVADQFVKRSYLTVALDHVGHGHSGGARGDIAHPNHFINDLQLVIDGVTKETGMKPVLFGHSMGGAIAALFAVRHQETLCALALSSPALRTHTPPALIALSRALSNIVPTMAAPAGLNQPATQNPEWEALKQGDPLGHKRMTLRLARFILDAGDEARRRAGELTIPVGMFVAGDDTFVDKRGAQEFFAQIKPGLGEYHEYPGYFHEAFNELKREVPLQDLDRWLGKLPAKPL